MKSFVLAMLAIVAMFIAVPSAEAHGGFVAVRDAYGNIGIVPSSALIVRGAPVVVSRGFGGPVVVQRGPVVVRGNVSSFNQNGGRNRVGFRR